MKSEKLQEKLRLHFPFKPTKEQGQLITDLANYITTLGSRSIFLLKGYAGTGKTTIVSAPTVRDEDGLAISTRNNYLSSEDRIKAPLFYQQLIATKAAIQCGADISEATKQAVDVLSNIFDVEYVEVLNANNLTQITTSSSEIIIISSVRLSETRLIDNIVFRRSNV